LQRGRVTDEEGNPLPYAYVFNLNARDYTVCDANGTFQVWASNGDTIFASMLGRHIDFAIAGDTLRSMELVLEKRPVELPPVVVYPWPGKRQFRHDFLAMKPLEARQLHMEDQNENDRWKDFDLMKFVPHINLYPGVRLYFLPYPDLIVNIDQLYLEIHKRARKKRKTRIVPKFE